MHLRDFSSGELNAVDPSCLHDWILRSLQSLHSRAFLNILSIFTARERKWKLLKRTVQRERERERERERKRGREEERKRGRERRG